MAIPAETHTQVVVVGAGPGGYPVACLAADAGMAVTLVDEGAALGGACLQRGCIPSKALLHLARIIREVEEASTCGLTFSAPEVNLSRVREWKDGVVATLAAGIGQLTSAREVMCVEARARFRDARTIELTAGDGSVSSLSFEHAVLATGSRPVRPSTCALDDPRGMASTQALELADIPQRLLVIGGGYIGLELGSVYAALGSRVTVVEMDAGLLPGADRDLVRPLARRLATQFEAICTKTRVVSLEAREDGLAAVFDGSDVPGSSVFDRVLLSVGRRPNSEDLGLDNTSVTTSERGHVVVDHAGRTAEPKILAVGDVCGEPMLAHKATDEARRVLAAIRGDDVSEAARVIPAVVFSDPEVAWCGVTEQQARDEQRPVKIARMPWAASGRAQTLGRTEGMTKLVLDPESEQVLGVGIVGVGAGELIGSAVMAVQQEFTAATLAESIHAHPTLSETLAEAADHALGRAVHLLPRRR